MIEVELSGLVLNIVNDALVLVLTWIKTARIRKSFSELGGEISMTMLLLRDGEPILFNPAVYPNHGLQRHRLLPVRGIATSTLQ